MDIPTLMPREFLILSQLVNRGELRLTEAEYVATRRDQSVEDFNAAQKVLLRIEHRLGEVLAATVKRGGDRKSKGDDRPLIPDILGDTDHKRKYASKRAQQLARIPWAEVEAKIDEQTANGKKATKSDVLNLAVAPHNVRTNGCFEWYTPPKFVEAARDVLGGIELDLASCDVDTGRRSAG